MSGSLKENITPFNLGSLYALLLLDAIGFIGNFASSLQRVRAVQLLKRTKQYSLYPLSGSAYKLASCFFLYC